MDAYIHTNHSCHVCSTYYLVHYDNDYNNFYRPLGYCSIDCYKKSDAYKKELSDWKKLFWSIQQLNYIKDALENYDEELLVTLIDDLIEGEV